MPNRPQFHEPDAIDCNTCVTALANDFGVLCDITTRYERDQVLVLVRCYKERGEAGIVVQVQAIVRAPLKAARSLYSLQYGALLDCWHQLDRGVLAAATTPVMRDWNGRPKQPRRANGQ